MYEAQCHCTDESMLAPPTVGQAVGGAAPPTVGQAVGGAAALVALAGRAHHLGRRAVGALGLRLLLGAAAVAVLRAEDQEATRRAVALVR